MPAPYVPPPLAFPGFRSFFTQSTCFTTVSLCEKAALMRMGPTPLLACIVEASFFTLPAALSKMVFSFCAALPCSATRWATAAAAVDGPAIASAVWVLDAVRAAAAASRVVPGAGTALIFACSSMEALRREPEPVADAAAAEEEEPWPGVPLADAAAAAETEEADEETGKEVGPLPPSAAAVPGLERGGGGRMALLLLLLSSPSKCMDGVDDEEEAAETGAPSDPEPAGSRDRLARGRGGELRLSSAADPNAAPVPVPVPVPSAPEVAYADDAADMPSPADKPDRGLLLPPT